MSDRCRDEGCEGDVGFALEGQNSAPLDRLNLRPEAMDPSKRISIWISRSSFVLLICLIVAIGYAALSIDAPPLAADASVAVDAIDEAGPR